MTYSVHLQATFDVMSRRMHIRSADLSEGRYRVWSDLHLIGDFSSADLQTGITFSAIHSVTPPQLVRLEGLDTPHSQEGRVWFSEINTPQPVNHHLWTTEQAGPSICVMVSANRLDRFFVWLRALQPFLANHLNVFLLVLEEDEHQTKLTPQPTFELTRQATVLTDPADSQGTAFRVDTVLRRTPAALCLPLCRQSARVAAYIRQSPVVSYFQAASLNVPDTYAMTLIPHASEPGLQATGSALKLSFCGGQGDHRQGALALCAQWFNLQNPEADSSLLPAPTLTDLLARVQEIPNHKPVVVLAQNRAEQQILAQAASPHLQYVPFRHWLAQPLRDSCPPTSDIMAGTCVVFAGTDEILDSFLDHLSRRQGGSYLSSYRQSIR